MQVSPSLAELMARLDDGPRGIDDALAVVERCAASSAPTLDLQQMDLTDDDLAHIANKLPALAPHLKELNLFMNEITVLPSSLAVLSGLESLLVGCNPLAKVDPALFDGLRNLTQLDIGYSEVLTHLPDTFHNLPSLRVLLAGNGRLASIPPSLFTCEKLEELHLYGNSLKHISDDVGRLANLRVLNVGRNQIETLPETIGKCVALETLHVYENSLLHVPKGITNLTNLKTINVLSNADIPIPPREVRQLGKATAIANFLATSKIN